MFKVSFCGQLPVGLVFIYSDWLCFLIGVFRPLMFKEIIDIVGILVHSSCYNKMLQTRWLINNRNLLLTVLEAGSLRSRCHVVTFWCRSFSWFRAKPFLLCPHMVGGMNLCKVPIPFTKAQPLWFKPLLKAHLLIQLTFEEQILGVRDIDSCTVENPGITLQLALCNCSSAGLYSVVIPIYWEKIRYKWTCRIQSHSFQGSAWGYEEFQREFGGRAWTFRP